MLRLRSADCNAGQLPHNSLLHIPLLAVIAQTAIGLSDAQFSRAQRRILSLPFGNPHRSYFANEIARLAESGIYSVHRKPR